MVLLLSMLMLFACLQSSAWTPATTKNIIMAASESQSYSTAAPTNSNPQVFVCTNKFCREKGSDATMAAFTFLTPEVIYKPIGWA
jgi:hypothetical protein